MYLYRQHRVVHAFEKKIFQNAGPQIKRWHYMKEGVTGGIWKGH